MARSTETMKSLDAEMMVNIEADQKVAEEGRKAAEEYARSWTEARDRMASQLDSFFREITSGGIGKAFLQQFEKLVSQMVATWLMGVRGMGQISRSGGLLGDFLGLGGTGVGSAFPAGAALSRSAAIGSPIFSDFSTGFTGPEASMLGLPLSAGGGAGDLSLSTLPAGASNAGFGSMGGIGGGFLSSLKGGGLMNLLTGGGILGGLQLFGSQNTALKSIGGFLAGGFGGLAIGSALSSLGVISPLVAFAGPIGAIAGALIGLFSGIFGRGKRKKEQTAVLQDMERQLNMLESSYNLHQTDYNSAIAQAEQIRQQYTQQQEQIQKGGGPSRVDPWVDALEQRINAAEQQRQNALAASANFGPAQFASGGFVHPSLARMVPGFAPAMHFAMGGAVPAIVHAGEYVLNAGAASRIGRGTLDSWNSGGSGMAVHLTVNAIDPRSFEHYLSAEGGVALRNSLRRASAEGRM